VLRSGGNEAGFNVMASFRKVQGIMRLDRLIAAALLAGVAMAAQAAPFEQVNKGYNRITSRVMIRKVAVPTLAALDYAAYFANPVRFDPAPQSPKKPAKKAGLADMTFSGALANLCLSIDKTPLTEAEKAQPMAWDPLPTALWKATKSDAIAQIVSKITGYKWADESIFIPYQEVAAVYLHGEGDNTQIWVKVEFKPWVKFLASEIIDEEKDGFKDVYGRLDLSAVDKAVLAKTIAWLKTDYGATVLTKEQAVDWATALASYWYPKLNTDVVDMTGQTKWPTPETEKDAIKELKGLTVENPLVVIRGTPYGKKLFNVYLVDFLTDKTAVPAAAPTGQPQAAAGPALIDTSVSKNFSDNEARFAQEVKANGDYVAWAKKEEPFRKSVLSYVKALPDAQKGFKGKDEWLFFQGEGLYLNSGDMAAQPKDKNPIPRLVELNKFLKSKNISMLFVPVPNKSDVYFDKLPLDKTPKDPYGIIHPYSRKFLADCQKAGIEVIDLLPAFLTAKKEDAKNKEGVYQRHDTHWSDRGLEIAATLISDRIKSFAWYKDLPKEKFTEKDTTIQRQGDIVDKLAEGDKKGINAVDLAVKQVRNPDGAVYKSTNADAPIILIGDSFTGVFESIDPKGAGPGAHVAASTGIPVDVITSWGGGPLVRDKFYRARKNSLDKKRVLIYMMVARDLYDYKESWLPMEMK
jgi:hypothetical protein